MKWDSDMVPQLWTMAVMDMLGLWYTMLTIW